MTVMQKLFIALSLLFLGLIGWQFSEGHLPYILIVFSAAFIALGIHDIYFSRHNLNRLYPIAAYLRYMLEYIRPEIRQYFIASDLSERPFTREQRSLVYQRAKGEVDTLPFGTEHHVRDVGYLSARHSLAPKVVPEADRRITIGGEACKQPYSASRLNISAMSFGALSDRAVRALNRGAKMGGFAHNTGEGGLSDYHLQEGGDIVWQIGTGYFGCRTKDGHFDAEQFKERSHNPAVKMIEIKLSQGAKPAHGGILPAAKVSAEIARIRGVAEGEDCISPPAHTAFDSPIGLLEFVQELRDLSGGKPVGFKLCVGIISEYMAICKAMLKTGILPDFITVDGSEGGTGAAPVEFTDRLGRPCLEGTHIVHSTLVGIGLRDKIKIITSGKTASGFDMLTKIAFGANAVNAARTMMFAVGCVQSRKCNTNECPTGVATQNKTRSKAIDIAAKSVRVKNFHEATVKSFLDLTGAMGLTNPDELALHDITKQDANETPVYSDELYPIVLPGQLLLNDGPSMFLDPWTKAHPDKF